MATLKDSMVMGPSRVIGDAFFGGVVMPTITETQDIGSSTMKWRYIYAKEIMGNIDPDKVLGDGLVAIKSGGTNSGSQTSNRVNWFNGTGIVSAANIWTDGSKLTVNGTAQPSGSTKFEVVGNSRISSAQSGSGGDISLELWRGSASSWKFLNDNGTLKLQNNYTTSAGSYFDVLTAAYNTGHITVTKGSVYPLDGNTAQSLGKDNARWDIYATNVDSGTIYVEGAAQFDGAIMAQSTLRVTGASTFIGAATFNNNTTTTGVATFNGNVQMNSSVSADSLTAGSLLVNGNTSLVNNTSSGHILPHATGTYDIGSSALKYREIYAGAMYATQFYGNATTATGWKSDLSLTIGNKTIAFNGDEGSVTYTLADIGVSDSGHTHTKIVTEGDNRGTATTPNDYSNAIRFRGLKTKAAIGTPTADSFAYLVGLRGWSDSSGGESHELAFHNSGISWRHGATTSWGNWYDLVYTTNKTAIGSVKHPVYVDAYGEVKVCNDATSTSSQYLETVSAGGAIGVYSNGSNTVGIYIIDKGGTSYYPFRFTTTGSSMPNTSVYSNIMFNNGTEPYLYGKSGWSSSARAWFSGTAYTGAVPTDTGTQLIMLSANRGSIQYNFPYQQKHYKNGTLDTSTVTGNNSFFFLQYSYSNSTSARLSYYDSFYLPKTAAGKTTNNSYAILTSKNSVTVSQGGTGRSSWTANHFVYSSDTTTLENTAGITTDGSSIEITADKPTITLTTNFQNNNTYSQALFKYDSFVDAFRFTIYDNKDAIGACNNYELRFYGPKSLNTSIDNLLELWVGDHNAQTYNGYPILHEGNWHKRIFANQNINRNVLTVTSSSWSVVPSGCVDIFGLSFKDTGLSTDTGDWRMWLASPSSGSTTLNMRIDGTFEASGFIGNASSATKATQDGDGNTIASTYLKLTGGTLTGALTASGGIWAPSIELQATTPYIDFHYNNDTSDYSYRLIASHTDGIHLQQASGNCWLYLGNGTGLAGIYWQTYGGGWYMEDTTWLRSYASKSVYTGTGIVRSDRVDGGGWIAGTHQGAFQAYAATSGSAGSYYQGWYVGKTPSGAWSWGVLAGYNDCYFCYGTDGNYNSGNNTAATIKFGSDGKVYSAVWNDYAEYRMSEETEPGRATAPDEKGMRQRTTQRLQVGVRIVSDTYGMAIGETDKAKTPMGLVGRVLVYPYKDITEYHVGDCVCSAPNGTVDIMTREEIRERPECIIGTVDEIPDYDTWDGTLSLATNGKTGHKIPVKGRIWIDIK